MLVLNSITSISEGYVCEYSCSDEINYDVLTTDMTWTVLVPHDAPGIEELFNDLNKERLNLQP